MSFTPEFLDELRARTGLSDLIARRVKLTRKGREHSGLCPFHSEKTPSFTVSGKAGKARFAGPDTTRAPFFGS